IAEKEDLRPAGRGQMRELRAAALRQAPRGADVRRQEEPALPGVRPRVEGKREGSGRIAGHAGERAAAAGGKAAAGREAGGGVQARRAAASTPGGAGGPEETRAAANRTKRPARIHAGAEETRGEEMKALCAIALAAASIAASAEERFPVLSPDQLTPEQT